MQDMKLFSVLQPSIETTYMYSRHDSVMLDTRSLVHNEIIT